MNSQSTMRTLRSLLSELRKCNSQGSKFRETAQAKYLLAEYRDNQVTDQQYCKAVEEVMRWKSKEKCSPEEFKIRGMHSCHSLLTCVDLNDVKIGKLLGVGGVKAVYHAQWKGLDVALSVLNNPNFESDFLSGIQNMKELQQNPFTIQAVGFCIEEHMYLSEFHSHGDASKIDRVLHTSAKARDGIHFRMSLCYNYVQILSSLHHARFPNGSYMPPKVVCDSNTLDKLLSQLLLTDDLSLILNDLDAVPTVGVGGVKCGHKALDGDFVAPEQRWNSPGEYEDALMMGYDEKTDIWKVPSVCSYFLDSVKGKETVDGLLKPIHDRCREANPRDRPSALEILSHYENVKKQIESMN